MLYLFALLDLFTAFVISFEQYLPWRILFVASLSLVTKALLFNDSFLSFIDASAAIYVFALMFMANGVLGWIFTGYMLYKFLVSIA